MNDYAEVIVLIEGLTERNFIMEVLSPAMAPKNVFLRPIILGRPKHEGGDIKFSRARDRIGHHLKERLDTWVTLMVDYYGINRDWPGYEESKSQADHSRKADVMNQATADEVARLFPAQDSKRRFIPYVSMHEIESLYFSDPACLAKGLGVQREKVDAILKECGAPEKINDHKASAPSKRIERLVKQLLGGRFDKPSTGITIAKEIGIRKMRGACPLFDAWLSRLESLAQT